MLGIRCLFGGAYSTCVYNIANSVSDLDFYLIIDKKDTDLRYYGYLDEDTLQDFILLDINYIYEANRIYYDRIKKYPSIWYRENEIKQNLNLHRADFTSQTIFEILYSDYVWDSGYLKKNYKKLLSELSYSGVLDYYFSRAYGNLINNLSKDNVMVSKYLMTFLGYACMCWLIEYRTVPNMNFEVMYDLYCPDEFRLFLGEAYKKQKELNCDIDYKYHTFNVGTHNLFEIDKSVMNNAKELISKPKVIVRRNEVFNQWIERELNKIGHVIYEVSVSDSKISLEIGDEAFVVDYLMS